MKWKSCVEEIRSTVNDLTSIFFSCRLESNFVFSFCLNIILWMFICAYQKQNSGFSLEHEKLYFL